MTPRPSPKKRQFEAEEETESDALKARLQKELEGFLRAQQVTEAESSRDRREKDEQSEVEDSQDTAEEGDETENVEDADEVRQSEDEAEAQEESEDDLEALSNALDEHDSAEANTAASEGSNVEMSEANDDDDEESGSGSGGPQNKRAAQGVEGGRNAILKWIRQAHIADSSTFLQRVSRDELEEIARQRPLTKAYVFQESFNDTSLHSIDHFMNILQDCYPMQSIHVRTKPSDVESMRVSTFCQLQKDRDLRNRPFNALNLRNIMRANAPRFTRLPDFGLLDSLVERLRRAWNPGIGKRTFQDPYIDLSTLRVATS